MRMLKARWQKLENQGELPSPRHGYRAVAVNDNMLIIHGGGDGRWVYRDLFILQPSTGEWKAISIPSLPERAGFGLALVNNNMYMFGGMGCYRKFMNDLYYLSLSTWKWDLMLPTLAPGTPPPCARVGHSFTRVNDHLILMFAGVTESAGHMIFLNDLYLLILGSNDSCTWRLINAQCDTQPPARESHSACLYKPDSSEGKLIIYGGMNRQRLDDIWSFDIGTYMWSQYCVPWGSNASPARSMHAATIAGSRMFVFGGWAPLDKHTNNNNDFISPKELCCFNLADKKWEKLDEQSSKQFPPPRTGHSMVVVQDRIYMWSGRAGSYNYHDDVKVLNDMWSLQVTPQKVMSRLILSNKTETMIKVEWDPVPLASHYILQIQVMPMMPSSNHELPSGLFSSSLNQMSNTKIPVPAINPKLESSKPCSSRSSTALAPIPTTPNRKSNLVSIPVKPKINTYQCLSPKFSTKAPTNNTPILSSSNIIANQVATPNVSISANNVSSKTSSVALSFGKNKHSIPIVTTRVCFSTEKSSSMNRDDNSSSKIPSLCLPTSDIPVCVINTPATHSPGAKHIIHTPVTKHPIHTSGTTPVSHILAAPGITTSDTPGPGSICSVNSRCTPGVSVSPGSSVTPVGNVTPVSICTPGSSYTPIIYTSVVAPNIPPHRSTLETFLKPKPIISRPTSVKLMRSSSGRPVAVVPKSLIPNRPCGTKPSNIVIVARKRPYI